MKRLTKLVVMTVCLAGVACERGPTADTPRADATWVAFTSPELKFEAEFPGAPERHSVPKDPMGQLGFEAFAYERGGWSYIIGMSDFSPVYKQIGSPSRLMNAGRDRVLGNSNTLVSEEKLVREGMPARRLSINVADPEKPGRMVFLLVLRGEQLYQVAVAGPENEASTVEREAERLAASFRLMN